MVLIIAGHIRSGTTLLRNLCNSHPDIAVTNELKYFAGLNKSFADHSRILIARLWGKAITGDSFQIQRENYAFACRYLFNLLRSRDGVTISAAAMEKALMGAFPRARIVGDKTPEYVFSLDKLANTEAFSCLVIFRDSRDVVSSTLHRVRTKWRGRSWTVSVDTPEKVAARWVRSIENIERNRDIIHIIRYEDLIREPRTELERLGRWLGVDPQGFPVEEVTRIRENSIGKYKTGLTSDELDAVMKITSPAMERLGYKV
jgi:hypothetical protein